MLIVCEFLEIIPKEIPSVTLPEEVDFGTGLAPGTIPISKAHIGWL